MAWVLTMTPSELLTLTATDTGAEPYMHSLDATDNDTFVAIPSSEDLDLTTAEDLVRVAASIVRTPKADRKKAKKDPSSGPPSPPDTGSTTSGVTIAECPKRLWPHMPPFNYGAVEEHKIFRSSFPQDRNVNFLKKLHIRSVLILVDTNPTPGYADFLSNKINHKRIDILPNKDGSVNTTLSSLCAALLYVLDARNQPVYIHCNQGKHRTGCVVACLRKIQRMPLDEILTEYRTYAGVKARDGDEEVIKRFDPEDVFRYAETNGYLQGSFASLMRADSRVGDVESLAAVLGAAKELEAGQTDVDMVLYDSSSEGSEGGMSWEAEEAEGEAAVTSPPTDVSVEDAAEEGQSSG